MVHLQADAEPFGHGEKAGQLKSGIDGHGSLSCDNFADPSLGNTDFLRETILGNSPGLQEFLKQNFTKIR